MSDKSRKSRTMTAAKVAETYGSGKHATDTTPARYAVMWRREVKGEVTWQQVTPRVRGGQVEIMSRTGIVARLSLADRMTVSDEVRATDVAVSWHRLNNAHAHGTAYGATQCSEPHLRGYGADGTSYCFARKAKTGASTKRAGLAAESAALAEREAAAAKRREAAVKAAATRKANRKATAGDTAADALAAIVGAA